MKITELDDILKKWAKRHNITPGIDVSIRPHVNCRCTINPISTSELRFSLKCSICKSYLGTHVVVDLKTGRNICSECSCNVTLLD